MTFKILLNINHFFLDGINHYETSLFNITNDNTVRTDFYTESFIAQFGEIEKNYPTDSAYAYCILNVPDDIANKSENVIKHELSNQVYARLQYLEGFLNFLWFTKDNSISPINAIGCIPEIRSGSVKISNQGRRSNKMASFQDSYFTQSDFESAMLVMEKYTEICPLSHNVIDDTTAIFKTDKGGNLASTILKGAVETHGYHYFNCLQRALVFLETARNAPTLVYKVAMYIPIFECLFSADSNEVTHKVAERAAFYLGETKEAKINIFETVKSCYAIRSKFLHGQRFNVDKAKDEYLGPLSSEIDEIARRALNKAIMKDSNKFLQSESGFKTFLERIIFE